MAKRKSCWAKNSLPFLCFLATVGYSAWFLAVHTELLVSGAGRQKSPPAKLAADGDPRVISSEDDAVGASETPAMAEEEVSAAAGETASEVVSTAETQRPDEDTAELAAEEMERAEPRAEPVKPTGAAPVGTGPSATLTVALAANSKQLDGVLVVINSALSNTKNPSKLRFQILTTRQDTGGLVEQVRHRLAKFQPQVSGVDFDPWLPRVRHLLGGKSSARKELFDELNFAAFYLHEALPKAGRVLYLDTDVVVTSDLAHLVDINLQGHPAAAAEDCSQRLGKYVDMGRMKAKGVESKLPLPLYATKKTCVVNRGVVLVDTSQWAASNITGAIESLVRMHLAKGLGPLWRAGVSQPPFLLAVAGRYHDLGAEFNVRGLGRGDIAPEEVDFYKKQKKWSSYFDGFLFKCKFHCCPGCKGWALSPHISPLAHQAKILHFNGRLKPSHQGFRGREPVKAPGGHLDEEERAAREQRPLCSCGSGCLQECAGIWWQYMPEK